MGVCVISLHAYGKIVYTTFSVTTAMFVEYTTVFQCKKKYPTRKWWKWLFAGERRVFVLWKDQRDWSASRVARSFISKVAGPHKSTPPELSNIEQYFSMAGRSVRQPAARSPFPRSLSHYEIDQSIRRTSIGRLLCIGLPHLFSRVRAQAISTCASTQVRH